MGEFDSQHIGTIPKNQNQEIHVSLSEHNANAFVDIRVFTDIPGVEERLPTKKGVTVHANRLDHLIAVLENARDELIRRGWLEEAS